MKHNFVYKTMVYKYIQYMYICTCNNNITLYANPYLLYNVILYRDTILTYHINVAKCIVKYIDIRTNLNC